MKWSKELETGIGLIDAEHIRIIEIVKKLQKEKDKLSDESVQFLFNNLVRYTERHFIVEEEYMSLYKYPNIVEHKKAHQQFYNRVASLKADFEADALDLSPSILEFFLNWLEGHIIHEDQKMAQFLQSLKVKEL